MPLSLAATGVLVGRYRAVELELHRRLGELVGSRGPAGVAVELALLSAAHGWRAELWASLLPVSVGLPSADELVRTPVEVEDVLDGATGEGLSATELLAGLADVLYPAMLDEYESRARRPAGASDLPLTTAARRAADDLRFTLGSARKLLGRLPETGSPATDSPATDSSRGVSPGATPSGLEQLMAAAGGAFGDISLLG